MAKQKTDLSEKHWQALKMLEEGMERKDVATKCGWKIDYMKKLCSGDISACGYTADLFKKELQKIQTKQEEDAKALTKEISHLSQEQIKRILVELGAKPKLMHDDKKLLIAINNSLTKAVPPVSIGNLSYSYVKGMTHEELILEFTRLQTIAESSFNRRAVQNPGQGGSGELSAGDE